MVPLLISALLAARANLAAALTDADMALSVVVDASGRLGSIRKLSHEGPGDGDLALNVDDTSERPSTENTRERISCISTPEEWFEAFDAGEDGCVSPQLFGHLGKDQQLSSQRPLAFLSGHTNLENYLTINKGFHQAVRENKLKRAEASIRVNASFCVVVGYQKKYIQGSNTFAVLSLPLGIAAVVPTWQQLFHTLEGFGLKPVPIETQRELTLAYGSEPDPVKAFSIVTGCHYDLVLKYLNNETNSANQLAVPSIKQAKCNPEFYRAQELTQGQQKGLACFANFHKAVDNNDSQFNAATVRAIFYECADASELFSGNGFGYNNVASPLEPGKTSGIQHYLGREFMVPNMPFSGLRQQSRSNFIHFPEGFQVQDQEFLNPDSGFWNGLVFPNFRATTR